MATRAARAKVFQPEPELVEPAPASNLLSWRALDSLVPYARNARVHSEAQVAQIAASIEEFGFASPVLADERGIIAGHGRVLAVRRLVDNGRVIRLPNGDALPAGVLPVIDCTGWSDARRRAYIIADNRLALSAGWDEEMLRLELAELNSETFALEVVGFTDQELVDYLKTANFPPGSQDGQGQLDEKNKVTCPQCGHVFTLTYGAGEKDPAL